MTRVAFQDALTANDCDRMVNVASSFGGDIASIMAYRSVAFRELFPDLKDSDFPFRGPVEKEGVRLLTASRALPIPTPPPMRNAGNYVASLCEIVPKLTEEIKKLHG